MTSPKARDRSPIRAEQLRIVPANEASWADIQAVFGTTDYPGRCYCQRFTTLEWCWSAFTVEERRERLRQQTNCGKPRARSTAGIVAYLAKEPVGWVAVAPRTTYPRLIRGRTIWVGREEDKTDDAVWSVTCFVVRREYRKRGVTYALASAAVDYAREAGARAVEGYALDTPPGKEITWGEMHVGARQVFAEAGFSEVSHPTLRRAVMRVDFPLHPANLDPD